jgi:hypothetical protein
MSDMMLTLCDCSVVRCQREERTGKVRSRTEVWREVLLWWKEEKVRPYGAINTRQHGELSDGELSRATRKTVEAASRTETEACEVRRFESLQITSYGRDEGRKKITSSIELGRMSLP